MAFNIEVISTAALTVQLTTKFLNYAEAEVPENDPNHVYDRVEISKIFLSIFDKLSTSTTPVYHRLKYSLYSALSTFVFARPAVGGTYFVNLIPLGSHATAGTDIPNGHIGFSTAENMYDVAGGDVLAHKVVGRVDKRYSSQTLGLRFELQYQVDPMTGPGGTSVGRNDAGTWTTYTQASNNDIMLVDADGVDTGTNDLQVRVGVAHLTENYDPGVNKLTRLYKRHDFTNANDLILPETLTVGGVAYTAEAVADNDLPIDVKKLLFTTPLITPPSIATIISSIDYVLLLSEDAPLGILPPTEIDDLVTVSISGKGQVDIQRYLLRSATDTTVINPGPHASTIVDVKIFRDKTTRIFTNLIWPDVYIETFEFDGSDSQSTQGGGSEFGFRDFEGGETRIGVSVDADHRVFLIVKLGMHSTSQLISRLVIAQGPAPTRPFAGIGGATGFFTAPYNYAT